MSTRSDESVDAIHAAMTVSELGYSRREVEREKEGSDESDAAPGTGSDLLARLGVDAAEWAAQFEATWHRLRAQGHSTGDLIDSTPGDWLHGWFCNAIEAGRSAGYAEGVKAEEVDRLGF